MWTCERLVEQLKNDGAVEYVFFWGHTLKVPGNVDRACFSQWFPCLFRVEGDTYRSAEHFMMAQKARCFDDKETLRQILAAGTAQEAKALGRKVKGFDPSRWDAVCNDIVVQGNMAKFSQDAGMQAVLLATGDAVLVEAAPNDSIWGIGLPASAPDASVPSRWRGENRLGFALMHVREVLRGSELR